MSDLTTLEILRNELAPIRAELLLIGEAISTLQRDMRMLRTAVNDIAQTNITAGEVEATHIDIDRALADIRDLAARMNTKGG